MAIQRGTLTEGVTLIGRHKRQRHLAVVTELDGGGIPARVRLARGGEYGSLSAAARVITGYAVNGWRWWSIAPGPPTSGNTVADTAPDAQPGPDTPPGADAADTPATGRNDPEEEEHAPTD